MATNFPPRNPLGESSGDKDETPSIPMAILSLVFLASVVTIAYTLVVFAAKAVTEFTVWVWNLV